MGDSDDEYDRKRRDKFRGERGGGGGDSYQNRREDRNNRDWQDRRGGARPDYRDYRQRERAYSPGPPVKRMRNDWDDGRSRFAPHDNYGGGGMYGGGYGEFGGGGGMGHFNHHGGQQMGHREPPMNPDMQTQPCMMTLKQFLATQDDSISDSEAITKYGEYKLDFKRQQLNEFFVAHKDEEWFKIKYHPEESLKRKDEQIGYLRKRVEVFLELLEKGDITSVPVDTTNTDQLAKLLDTAVIKLEGGNEEDLKVLEEKPVEIVIRPEPKLEVKEPTVGDGNITDEKIKTEEKALEETEEKSKKRRRSSDSTSSSNSDSDSESGADKEEKKKESSVEKMVIEESENKPEAIESHENGNVTVDSKNESSDSLNEQVDQDKTKPELENDEGNPKRPDDGNEEMVVNENKSEVVDLVDEPKIKLPEELHKTSSIFLRNLAPTITKAEVEAMCKRYDGFLRVAIADPLVERRWFRRGWITFKREVNIKEICWNLNNIRLRDCELGAIVNRDLSRRVRPVNGITAHKTICKSDIKLCAKIAHGLDEKAGLWNLIDGVQEVTKHTFGLQSKNPVLKNITDYLIEEASAEEDELLGLTGDTKGESEGEMLDRDAELIAVLDKIILYLRIVHSVDFYNHCEYPYEDEMPNRCGIIHARGPPPQTKITSNDIQDYMRNFESKLSQLLSSNVEIPAEELIKLGSKDVDAEVEKFITANSQELSKDKWLCPLSGKKFKGPDYIRKHIFNKHAEKVEEVKNEVEYFNNYMKDSKRPQLPEHPGNPGNGKKPEGAQMQGYRAPFAGPGMHQFQSYGGHFGAGMPHRGRGGFGRGGRIPAPEYRPVIHYRDLDDPSNFDEFI